MSDEPRWWWLALPLALGALLRGWGLPGQILGGDELHAVRAVLELSWPEILVTYRPQDACLPLSALYRLLLVSPLPFGEMTLRAPILLFSLATVGLAPWLVRRAVPRSTAWVFALLLAISPILVLYGRIVRSYAPVVLIAFAAVAVFWSWLEAPSRGRAVAYALLAALAVYFHLVVLAFVLAPIAFAALERLPAAWREEGGAGLARALAPLAKIAAAVLALVALFLVPGWVSLGPMIGEKRQPRLPDLETVAGVSRLQSGSTSALVAALFYAAAVLGLVLLLRHRRRFGLYTLALVAGHALGMVVLRPLNLHLPPQFTRYNLVLIPILLLWVAAATTLPWTRRGAAREPARRRTLRLAAGGALLAALALTSPFTDPIYARSEFVHHKDFLGFYAPRATLAPADVPELYRRLGERRAPDEAVLEYPWHTSWRLARTPYVLQEVHRRPLYLAPMQKMLWDPRLDVERLVPGRPRDFLRSPARWLVVYLDRGALEDRVIGDHRSPRRGWKLRGREWDWMRREGRVMSSRLRELWGAPDLADGVIEAWDLERLRGERAGEG